MEDIKPDAPRNPPPLVILLKEPAQKQPPQALKIIDLPSKSTKMAHQRRFCEETSAEHSRGEVHCYRRMVDASGREIFVSKLPSGEYLVEQSPKSIKKPQQVSTNAMNSLRQKIEEKISAKRTFQPEKIKRLQVRRNPSRLSRKKSDEDYPRPRLLALKRRGIEPSSSSALKKLKLSDVPYMNTRSVTKRLYNVGATLQTPTIKDEFEFREWPVHGMHERPVYHPQVGLGVEFIGRCFTSFDDEGYHEIPRNSEVDIIPLVEDFDFGKNSRKRMEESEKDPTSFEKCMHWSFHAVLSYAAQIMSPEYKKIDEKISAGRLAKATSVQSALKTPETIIHSTTDGVNNAEWSSKNQTMSLQPVLSRGKKLIIAKPSEVSTSSNFEIEQKNDNSNSEMMESSLESAVKSPETVVNPTHEEEKNEETPSTSSQLTENYFMNEKILKELMENTALLVCTAMSVHQDHMARYIDGLVKIEGDKLISRPFSCNS